MKKTVKVRAHVGDMLEVTGHRVGERARLGEIVQVLGTPGHEHYRVQWDDGHESAAFYPGSDVTIRRPAR